MIKDLEKRIFIVQKYFETGSCTLVQRQWKLNICIKIDRKNLQKNELELTKNKEFKKIKS
jgi:hypothetical protein